MRQVVVKKNSKLPDKPFSHFDFTTDKSFEVMPGIYVARFEWPIDSGLNYFMKPAQHLACLGIGLLSWDIKDGDLILVLHNVGNVHVQIPEGERLVTVYPLDTVQIVPTVAVFTSSMVIDTTPKAERKPTRTPRKSRTSRAKT